MTMKNHFGGASDGTELKTTKIIAREGTRDINPGCEIIKRVTSPAP